MKSIISDSIWLGNYIFFYQGKVGEFSKLMSVATTLSQLFLLMKMSPRARVNKRFAVLEPVVASFDNFCLFYRNLQSCAKVNTWLFLAQYFCERAY